MPLDDGAAVPASDAHPGPDHGSRDPGALRGPGPLGDADGWSRGGRPALVVATALLVMALSNLAVMPIVELEARSVYGFAHVGDGHDQLVMLEENVLTTQRRFLMESRLAVIAPDLAVVVPPGVEVQSDYLVGLGDVDEIVRLEEGLVLEEGVLAELDRFVVATGEDDTLGAYRIVLDEGIAGEPSTMVFVPAGATVDVVDRRLLERLGVEVTP